MFRSFTPSTSNSSAPSSSTEYMTGMTCGQPEGLTVAKRPIRCDLRNSSSLGVNSIFPHILDCTIHVSKAASPSLGTVGGYTVRRREPLERLEGAYLELEHDRTGARHIPVEAKDGQDRKSTRLNSSHLAI